MALPYKPSGGAATRETANRTTPHPPCRGRFHIGPGTLRRRGVPGRDKSRPYEQILCFGPTGTAAAPRYCNLCRGRCSHRPGEPRGVAGAPGRDLRPKSRRCAAVGLRNAPAGAVNPAPTNLPKRPVKPDGRGRPGGRRAGCPHPAGPCGGARSRFLKSPRCGGRERPPYGAGKNMVDDRQSAAAARAGPPKPALQNQYAFSASSSP